MLQHELGAETLMRTESLDGKYIRLASRIFNSSARISDSRNVHDDCGSHSNLGLGLYIAREVVLAHGGSIAVVSNVTEGTTFTVLLPKHKT